MSVAVELRDLGLHAASRIRVRYYELLQFSALLGCVARILAAHHARVVVRLLGPLTQSNVLTGVGCSHCRLRAEINVDVLAALGEVALRAALRARLIPLMTVALVVVVF